MKHKEKFKYIKANHFFQDFAPGIKNWRLKMTGKNSNGNTIDFTAEDERRISKGMKKIITEIAK